MEMNVSRAGADILGKRLAGVKTFGIVLMAEMLAVYGRIGAAETARPRWPWALSGKLNDQRDTLEQLYRCGWLLSVLPDWPECQYPHGRIWFIKRQAQTRTHVSRPCVAPHLSHGKDPSLNTSDRSLFALTVGRGDSLEIICIDFRIDP